MYGIINNHTRGKLTPNQRLRLRDAIQKYEASKGVVVKTDRCFGDKNDVPFQVATVESLIKEDDGKVRGV